MSDIVDEAKAVLEKKKRLERTIEEEEKKMWEIDRKINILSGEPTLEYRKATETTSAGGKIIDRRMAKMYIERAITDMDRTLAYIMKVSQRYRETEHVNWAEYLEGIARMQIVVQEKLKEFWGQM